MDFWWVYLLIGATAGVLGSMLGVGGGILMVPAMILICHLKEKSAAAMSLAVMIPMALTSIIRYRFQPEVWNSMKLWPTLFMAAAAIGGALIGTEIVRHLSGTAFKRVFAVIMVLVAVKIFLEKDQPAPSANPGGAAAARGEPAEGTR